MAQTTRPHRARRRIGRQTRIFEQRMEEADTPSHRLGAACGWLMAVSNLGGPPALDADTEAVMALIQARRAANDNPNPTSSEEAA